MQSVSTEEPAVISAKPSAAAPVRPKHKGSAQLFKNPVLERLSHTHIALPVGIFAATAILSLYYGLTHGFMSGASALGLFMVGLLGFTFVEYAVHRYLYHLPATTENRAKLQYTMHGVHHEYPKDKTRLAMPPIITVFVSSLLFFIFRLSFGSYAFGLLAGFTFGYATYLFVHYAIHAYAPPKTSSKCGGRTTPSTTTGKTRWPSAYRAPSGTTSSAPCPAGKQASVSRG